MSQRNLPFTNETVQTIPFVDAASQLGVSVASIRNWIKTGLLKASGRNELESTSWNTFVADVAGKEKLTKRANKTHGDSHDHLALIERISAELKLDGLNLNELSSAYENSLSNSYRNVNGIYYTPQKIVDQFFSGLPVSPRDQVFCDPSCGTGNFLLGAVRAGFLPENLVGFDVDSTALSIARERLREVIGQAADVVNLQCRDFLSIQKGGFDVVITNPPWGKKLDKTTRVKLSARFKTGKSNDTCSMFVAAALEHLNDGGILGMLLPDSFFNVASFSDVRQQVAAHQILEFRDFGKPFSGLMTKAKSLVLRKTPPPRASFVKCSSPEYSHSRSHLSFVTMPKVRFNFAAKQRDISVIKRLFLFPHVTLKDNAQWGMGVVTGNNKLHVKSKLAKGLVPVWKGADVSPDGLAPATNFISSNFEQYQQVPNVALFRVSSKIIYRFIGSRLTFFCDTEQRFLLNSANFLIPNPRLGISNSVLSHYLNSDLMNWLFQTVFETHKILRSDLEYLPIFTDFLATVDAFDERDLLNYLGVERIDGTYRTKK